MVRYIIFRVLVTIPVLFAVSALVFIIIQLPPGDITTPCKQDPYDYDC
mgnify:CR=1 FL=1